MVVYNISFVIVFIFLIVIDIGGVFLQVAGGEKGLFWLV